MAMLAEPRQRMRYNLVPKGKALYEDQSRFGTKMLEKMGWKKGQGLGANLNGSQDFVRIRFKNDISGLGFVQRDDQWTLHEQSFNGLLKTLNEKKINKLITDKLLENDPLVQVGFGLQKCSVEEHVKQNVETLKEKISGVSLEERSRQSKVRVHYKKFTKGKDVAQYSEKDLANIFGKKSVVNHQITVNDDYKHFHNDFGRNKEVVKNVRLINTGVSVNDYFKTKVEQQVCRKNGVGVNANVISEKFHLEENFNQDSMENNRDTEKKYVIVNEKKEREKNKPIIYNGLSQIDYLEMQTTGNGRNFEENISNVITSCDIKKSVAKRKRYVEDLENHRLPVKMDKSKKNANRYRQKHKHNENEAEYVLGNCTTCEKKNYATLLKNFQQTDLIFASDKKSIKDKDKKHGRNVKIETNEIPIKNYKSLLIQPEQFSPHVPKKLLKSECKDLSFSTKNICINDIDFQTLDPEEMRQNYRAFNIYTMSSFCAEKFRNIDLNDFAGSVLPQIEGYGLSSGLQLHVQIIKNDEERITNLWRGVLNKYDRLGKSKKIYKSYVKKFIAARKTKQKTPKLCIKSWKRKNAFQVI